MSEGRWPRNRPIDTDRALDALRALAVKLGRTPAKHECNADNGCPSDSWYRIRFGNFEKACVAAGLTPRERGRNLNRPKGCREPHKKRAWCPPIDPVKVAEINERVRAHWFGTPDEKRRLSTWVHPYAVRRSDRREQGQRIPDRTSRSA